MATLRITQILRLLRNLAKLSYLHSYIQFMETRLEASLLKTIHETKVMQDAWAWIPGNRALLASPHLTSPQQNTFPIAVSRLGGGSSDPLVCLLPVFTSFQDGQPLDKKPRTPWPREPDPWPRAESRQPSPPPVDTNLNSQLGREMVLPPLSELSLMTLWLLSVLTYFSKRRLLIGELQY